MADTSFFGRLRKLFSQKAIVTVTPDGKRKVFDFDERQETNLSSLRDRYTKIQKSFYEQAGGAQSMAYQQVRREVFRDYDAMDQDPIIASALDIYADESTLKNEFGDMLIIRSDNPRVQELLENLYYDILNIEFSLWPWVRNMCKYGDFFLGLEIADGKGIVNVTPYSQYNTERLEGNDPTNPHMVKFRVMDDAIGKVDYDNFEIAHFRLLSDTNWLPYGKSMVENGRRLWKQLSLMEDAMLIHRIMRAPEKRVFKIDIGNINPTEVDNYMQRIITKMKKVPFVNKDTGDYNLKYNMQNLTEDFYLPVRGGDSGTNIENLSGLEYTATEDIEYLKGKLFAALKIPKAYLGYDENVNGKATLAAEDVRFARTIERIQKMVTSELSRIGVIHLFGNGIQDAEMTNFEISLVNPSTIYEQEKVNLWSEKIRLATDMQSLKMLSKDWIYDNIFKMSESEQTEQRGKIVEDIKDTFRYNSIENEGNDPANPPKQTDVEESLENLKSELKANVGRPREGNTYGKDKHPYGRDPLGDNERTSKRSRTSEHKAKTFINGIASKRKFLHEMKDMLDETNIIDDTEN
mgnify:CR=1 FL=1|jgi:hypothetical protein